MGRIAEDMIRLIQEIRAGHAERQAYIDSLKVSVAQMRAGFRSAQAQLARESAIARREVVNDLLLARRAWAALGLRTAGAGRLEGRGSAEAAAAPETARRGRQAQEQGRGRKRGAG
jgi:hypothetical protein